MSEMIRMGIIVIGSMSTGHARHVVEGLCPDFVLCAVADCNPARPERAKDKLGDSVVCFSEALPMLDSDLIDACIVSVPPLRSSCAGHGMHAPRHPRDGGKARRRVKPADS